MDTMSKDARGLVDGVVRYLSTTAKASPNLPKVRTYLMRMTASARRARQAHIETSVALTAQEKERVRRFLTDLVAHTVTPYYTVRIHVGDLIVDTTLEKQVDDLAQSLL
jgi:F0F1-type ATP synthase delta subunit